MIKCNKGRIEVCGTAIDIIAELATLVHAIHGDFKGAGLKGSEELIRRAVEDGLKTEEQLDEEIKAAVKEKKLHSPESALDRLVALMEEAFAGKEKKDGRAEK